jgi:hypothetical protein
VSALALALAGALVAAAALATQESGPPLDPGVGASSPPGTPTTMDPSPSPSPTEPPPVPVRFRVTGVDRVFVGPRPARRAVQRTMRRVATAIRSHMTRLYRVSFVNHDSWRTGRYGEAIMLFDRRSRRAARKDLAILTLGPRAEDRYASVLSAWGRLRVQALLGPRAGPLTAVATVFFRARAETLDGSVRIIVSEGRYFLRPVGSRWTISAYRVRRRDHPAGG